MNYYEHHIGDYDADTAHLSWAEDMAYTRLMRLYYRREAPIPVAVADACRLIRAITREQRAAVESVLKEFFELAADGWHQKRCDDEIARYNDGAPEREMKKKNEATRLARYRDERARLFGMLHEAGMHAAWNVSMADLRALVAKHCNGEPEGCDPPATEPATRSRPLKVTAPATPVTATQTPDTRHQSPDTSGIKPKAAATLLPDWVDPALWQVWKDHRRACKAPMTAKAESLLLNVLAGLKATGNDPVAVIEQSVSRGWKGFFAVNDRGPRSASQPTRQEALEARNAATAALWTPPQSRGEHGTQ